MNIPLSEIINNCLVATAKVLLLCLGGVTLARIGVLSEKEVRSMSKVAQDLFIPALLFSNFVEVSFDQIVESFPLVIISIMIIIVGMEIGKFVMTHIIKNDEYKVMFPLVCGFAHTLNIQLAMSETLGGLLDKISILIGKEYKLSGEARGVIFTMIITIVNTFLRWSLMSKIIKENEKDYKSLGSISKNPKSLEMRLLSPEGKINKTQTPEQMSPIFEEKKPWWKSLDSVINAPLIVCFFTIFLSLIPPLQQIFIDESSFVYKTFTRTAQYIGRGSSPILLVLLGANLGSPKSTGGNTSFKALASITFAKMILMPIIGIVIILILQSLSLMSDPAMVMITLVTFGAPTANNILIQYASLGKELGEISRIVLASYVVSVFTLPLLLVIFFSSYAA